MHRDPTPAARSARNQRRCAAVAMAAGIFLSTGCSGSGTESAGGDTASAMDGGPGAPDAAGQAAGSPERQAQVGQDAAAAAETVTVVPGDRIVREVTLSVTAADVAEASRRARLVAEDLGGVVADEATRFAGEAETSKLTLRVPVAEVSTALTRLEGLGDLRDRSATSEDVTGTLVDLDSRTATQTRSVGRIRQLLDDAADLDDVVLLESELARRESDLESLQAQREALADRADLSTISLTVRSERATAAAETGGFRHGLSSGVEALQQSTSVALTITGAVLPFGVPAAVIAALALLIHRRRSTPTASEVP